jgi:hypothetical protein
MQIKSISFLLAAFFAVSILQAQSVDEELSNSLGIYQTVDEQLSPLEISQLQEEQLEEFPEEVKAMLMYLQADKVDFSDQHLLHLMHKSAKRFPSAVMGDLIRLDDASTWTIHPDYIKHVSSWEQKDVIFIKPNANASFSIYSYVLQNRTKHQEAEVKFSHIDQYFDVFNDNRRCIDKINYDEAKIVLRDSGMGKAIWQISPSDYTILSTYETNYRVIVGVNTNWRMDQYPNILINLYLNKHVEAKFMGNEK